MEQTLIYILVIIGILALLGFFGGWGRRGPGPGPY